MQEIIKAVVLGIIQGLSEFLPISSTAHLRIIPSFFGWKDIGAAYTAVIQIGTMIAIIIYFWKDLYNMFFSFIASVKEKSYMTKPDTRLLFMVCIGTIPIMIFGYLFKDIIRTELRNIYIIAADMVVFSLIIYAGERYTKKTASIEKLSLTDSIIIGFFQALALIPGTSRSGSTMTGAFLRNMDRESAARYSFLLSIPAVLISGLYELYSERASLFVSEARIESLIIATIVSGVVGYISIWFFLAYLKKHSLMLFIVYRILFGLLIIILLITKVIVN
jgi:undecaprenyl-diphosphatase